MPQAPPPSEESPEEMESNAENSAEGSFVIPSDSFGGKQYKTGDTIQLEVIGMDESGGYEVKHMGGGEDEGDMADEMRAAMSGESSGETMDDGAQQAY